MAHLLDVVSIVCIVSGMFFFAAGSIGLLRFPDIYSRLHALTKADNLGLGFITLGLICQATSFYMASLLIVIWVLVMIFGAVTSFLVANHSVVTVEREQRSQVKAE